jgi:glycine/D-amino acid oxidase-like deaminating enzyme/nitrite reductase/ring-hydroxylating ferredoxin subunit
MRPSSLWIESPTLPHFSRLAGTHRADVAVVGAGITGLTTALLLQRAGRKVVVVERERVGSGETGKTTAHLTAVLDSRYHVLASKFGHDGARAAAASSLAAIDQIEAFTREFAQPCGFSRVPAFLYAENEEQRHELERELSAMRDAGLAAEWADVVPLPLPVRAAIRVGDQAQFDPMEYLLLLTTQFVAAGGAVFEQSRALDIADGQPCQITTEGGKVIAEDVVVATNQPVSDRFAMHTKIAAYRTYAVAAPLDQGFPAGLFWDLQDPYHYIRQQVTAAGAFLIVGGEDHKTGKNDDTNACYSRLETYARRFAPGARFTHRWSGQVVEPVDGLPFIGRDAIATHTYVGTGYSGNGITFGTVAAKIFADELQGTKSPWADLYQATRIKPLAQIRHFVSENVDFPATLARDRLARGQVHGPEEIRPGEGRLLRADGKTLAVHRDASGRLHTRSATCPHLGCHVNWNNAEQTWDCPCHGSRFDVEGRVLNGPATQDLAAASPPSEAAAAKSPD